MLENDNNSAADENSDKDDAGEDQGSEDQNKDAIIGADEDNSNDEDTDEGGDDDGDTADEDKGQDGDSKDAKAPKDKDSSKDDDEDDDDDDGKDPDERKNLSTQDFIIGRQRKKLSKKKAKADAEGDDDDDFGDSGDDDDDIDPKDEAIISKVFAKKIAPIIEKSVNSDNDKEVKDFLADNPDFKPFEKKVRRFMTHPSRTSLPIKSIFYEVAGDKLLKIGAKRQKEADTEAKNSQSGGGSTRDTGKSKTDNLTMPKEDFQKKQEKLRQGK